VGDDQPPNLSAYDGIKQALQALLMVVHARAKVGNDLEGPALPGAVQFQPLFLSL